MEIRKARWIVEKEKAGEEKNEEWISIESMNKGWVKNSRRREGKK